MSNLGDNNTPPLLRACDDPMYPGPMKRIAYEYKPGGPNDELTVQIAISQVMV